MLGPKLDRFSVLVLVQRYPAPPLRFSQRISHHRDGLHGQLVIAQLPLDADDAPRRVGVCRGVAHGLVLFPNLVSRVEYYVQPGGIRWVHLGPVDVLNQDREFAFFAADGWAQRRIWDGRNEYSCGIHWYGGV